MTTATAAPPRIGLVVPPAEDRTPPEAEALFGSGIEFVSRGLGIAEMSPAGFDAGLERLEAVVRELVRAGARALSVMGTSLTFYNGSAGNERILRRLRHAGDGIPATTMATSVVEGLRAHDARRISVVGAYTPDMGRRLERFLDESGFAVLSRIDLGVKAISDLSRMNDDMLQAAAERAIVAAGPHRPPDALLISCGGLRTLEVSARLTVTLGLPVVSSAVDGLRGAAALLGR